METRRQQKRKTLSSLGTNPVPSQSHLQVFQRRPRGSGLAADLAPSGGLQVAAPALSRGHPAADLAPSSGLQVAAPALSGGHPVDVALTNAVNVLTMVPVTSHAPAPVAARVCSSTSSTPGTPSRKGCQLRMDELDEPGKAKRKEHKKIRKRAYRARKGGMSLSAGGSISVMQLLPLQLNENIPSGKSWKTVLRQLSLVSRFEISCFRSVKSITKEEYDSIYRKLTIFFMQGEHISYEWVKAKVRSMIQSRRTRVRNFVKGHLEQITAAGSGSPIPPIPQDIHKEEYDFFVTQLRDDAFQAQSTIGKEKSKSMIEKLGCGNPLGHGGIENATAKIAEEKKKQLTTEEKMGLLANARVEYKV